MKLDPKNHLSFILGGNAYFTMKNIETGGRFTYRVSRPEDKDNAPDIWFVKLLTGPDNTNNYQYIGFIKKDDLGLPYFVYGKKSKIGATAQGVVAFTKVFNGLLRQGKTLANLEIWHEGKCCRCGRKLTVPESIQSGIGPECARINTSRTVPSARAQAMFESIQNREDMYGNE